MGTGGRWRRGGSCEAREGLLSLSLTGAGLMLKPLDCGEDEQDAEMMILIVGGCPAC